ncbi:hypothetical protein DFA_08288 [Cavenderia fasciculata]|uniref:Uncharacterized protein n=1 Tax=Cavenderia fasciculata TaxID=261658 RepID=F4Q5N6_CACFS|nr:uncharacterized protein DFA_08288 [Cavenderia fasciculata]EGG17295.1 hypothetical protein DFA_08288 [Cavenderia fasciculata]|eukprot:XP_004355779.1 hypothetical protein DFA_08288 [Cavenderia fasciculata]
MCSGNSSNSRWDGWTDGRMEYRQKLNIINN